MLEGLREHAESDAEKENLEAVIAANGNRAEAARKLGKGRVDVKESIIKVKKRAAEAPKLSGTSTLIRHKDKDDSSTGKILEWIKTRVDYKQQADAAIQIA